MNDLIELVTVSPTPSEAAMIIVLNIKPTTIRVVCAGLRGMFRNASLTNTRFLNPDIAIAAITISSVRARPIASSRIGITPNSSFIPERASEKLAQSSGRDV